LALPHRQASAVFAQYLWARARSFREKLMRAVPPRGTQAISFAADNSVRPTAKPPLH